MRLQETFVDEENINFVFEYLPGHDLFWVLSNENNLNLSFFCKIALDFCKKTTT